MLRIFLPRKAVVLEILSCVVLLLWTARFSCFDSYGPLVPRLFWVSMSWHCVQWWAASTQSYQYWLPWARLTWRGSRAHHASTWLLTLWMVDRKSWLLLAKTPWTSWLVCSVVIVPVAGSIDYSSNCARCVSQLGWDLFACYQHILLFVDYDTVFGKDWCVVVICCFSDTH